MSTDVLEIPTVQHGRPKAKIPHPRLAQETPQGQTCPPGRFEVRVLLAEHGDKRFSWNPLNLAEIREAEAFFLKAVAEGLVPYRVGPDGQSAEVMPEFLPGDGEAVFKEIADAGDRVVMQPQRVVAGG